MKRNTLKCNAAANTTTKGPKASSLVSIFTLQEGLAQHTLKVSDFEFELEVRVFKMTMAPNQS